MLTERKKPATMVVEMNPEHLHKKTKEAGKMANKKILKTGFTVYDFMIDRLCLTGAPLLLYALIFSFTRGGGNCHGSVEYMGCRTGAAISTVKRGLHYLLDRRLILKSTDSRYRTKVYTINPVELLRWVPEIAQYDPSEKDTETDSFSPPEQSKSDPNNKEIINSTTTTSYIHSYKEDEQPNYLCLGECERVIMTMEQHLDLINKLGMEVVRHYINRLEQVLITNPGIQLKNHYRTIIKWAQEDAGLL